MPRRQESMLQCTVNPLLRKPGLNASPAQYRPAVACEARRADAMGGGNGDAISWRYRFSKPPALRFSSKLHKQHSFSCRSAIGLMCSHANCGDRK